MADRGVVVEFDFAAMDGAELLFDATEGLLKNLDGIPFDAITEARHMAGRTYLDGLTRYFAVVRTKKTALKASRDLADAFAKEVSKNLPSAITPGLRNFVKILTDRGVRVVLSTRGSVEAVSAAFEGLLGERVALYRESSAAYGFAARESWIAACIGARIHRSAALAVTGSGFGVRAALMAGIPSLAVVRPHVAYQDFSGANAVVPDLNAAAAKAALSALGLS